MTAWLLFVLVSTSLVDLFSLYSFNFKFIRLSFFVYCRNMITGKVPFRFLAGSLFASFREMKSDFFINAISLRSTVSSRIRKSTQSTFFFNCRNSIQRRSFCVKDKSETSTWPVDHCFDVFRTWKSQTNKVDMYFLTFDTKCAHCTLQGSLQILQRGAGGSSGGGETIVTWEKGDKGSGH